MYPIQQTKCQPEEDDNEPVMSISGKKADAIEMVETCPDPV